MERRRSHEAGPFSTGRLASARCEPSLACAPAAEGVLHLPNLLQVNAGRLVLQEPVELFGCCFAAAGLEMQNSPQTPLANELRVDDEHCLDVTEDCLLVRLLLGQAEQVLQHPQ